MHRFQVGTFQKSSCDNMAPGKVVFDEFKHYVRNDVKHVWVFVVIHEFCQTHRATCFVGGDPLDQRRGYLFEEGTRWKEVETGAPTFDNICWVEQQILENLLYLFTLYVRQLWVTCEFIVSRMWIAYNPHAIDIWIILPTDSRLARLRARLPSGCNNSTKTHMWTVSPCL